MSEKCPNTPYSVRMQENIDQKKLRIWTLFKQCKSSVLFFELAFMGN